MRVGYEMVDNLLISNKREWNSSFIKNAHKISRIFPDFICKSNRFFSSFLITVTIWYNGSYTLMAKPVRAPESHYPIILSLVSVIPFWSCSGIHRAGVCQLINWIWQIDCGRTQQPFCFYQQEFTWGTREWLPARNKLSALLSSTTAIKGNDN